MPDQCGRRGGYSGSIVVVEADEEFDWEARMQ
jgi:hypothetical protein